MLPFRAHLAGFSILFLAVSGCATISSARVTKAGTLPDPIVATAGYYFLPKALLHLDGERKAGSSECTLILKDVVYAPDPRYLFGLRHLRNIFADDNVKVTLTPSGLLSKIEITTEDKTGQVIVKLAELAKELIKATFTPGVPFGAGLPFQVTFVIDPTVPADRDRVAESLRSYDCHLEVALQAQDNVTYSPNKDPETRDGVFIRPALPYRFIIQRRDGENITPVTETVVSLPNEAPILSLDLHRAAFVKLTQTLDFDNGILKGVSINKPSEAVGFVSIPVDVVKTIVSIPGELFKFKADIATQQKGDLEAQKAVLDAQKQLLQSQDELRKALEQSSKPKP
jgi:hypothetical protein